MDDTLGNFIKKLRQEKGISGRELARRSEISQAYLSQLETGQNENPTPQILKKLANGLGITSYDLMAIAGHYDKDDLLEPVDETINSILNKVNRKRDQEGNHIINLKTVLDSSNLTYGDTPISNKDKHLIISYLDALFSDRE